MEVGVERVKSGIMSEGSVDYCGTFGCLRKASEASLIFILL